jgi:hypothetical protein
MARGIKVKEMEQLILAILFLNYELIHNSSHRVLNVGQLC